MQCVINFVCAVVRPSQDECSCIFLRSFTVSFKTVSPFHSDWARPLKAQNEKYLCFTTEQSTIKVSLFIKKIQQSTKKKENNCAGFISYLVYKNLCKTQSYKWKLITLHRLQRRKKHSFNEKWSPLVLEVKAPWLYN